MKTAIATMHSADWAILSELTVRSKQLYCERHGYELVMQPWDQNRGNFQKLDFVANLLPHFDVVMWMDCDAMICNPNITIDSLLAVSTASLLITTDLTGINNGVFIIRRDRLMMQLMYTLVTIGPLIYANALWGDNAAMSHFLGVPPYSAHIAILPQKSMNSYMNSEYGRPDWFDGTYSDGDFILHLPGMPLQRRVELARQFAAIGKPDITAAVGA